MVSSTQPLNSYIMSSAALEELCQSEKMTGDVISLVMSSGLSWLRFGDDKCLTISLYFKF